MSVASQLTAGRRQGEVSVAKQKNDDKPAAAGESAAAVKVAVVTPEGGSPVEVEYPADAKDAKHAAVEAYKARAGIWSLPTEPAVEFPDRGK